MILAVQIFLPKKYVRSAVLSFTIAATCLATVSCRQIYAPQNENSVTKEVRSEMRDVYSASSELFGYVWSNEEFSSPRAEGRIISLLDKLSTDFHKVERDAPLQYFEPGFRLAMQLNQDLLRDAKRRFQAGEKDYARWRLRSLAGNCVACHTRFEVKSDFLGSAPQEAGNSFEAKFAVAEFLLASRQFDESSADFMQLAKEMLRLQGGKPLALTALKEWLVIQVRIKQRFADAVEELSPLLKNENLGSEGQMILENWVGDLRSLEAKRGENLNPIRESRALLSFTKSDEETILHDERNLVKSLRVTALLHEFLQATPSDAATLAARRSATYLLSLAYAHMPIRSFDAYRELYLEQCIREYPHSKESMQAFLIYQDMIEERNSGSGGLSMDTETQQKLRELRTLAFGNQPKVLDDSISITE